eukprot:11329033-Prorocentrum_lima.AAC.1
MRATRRPPKETFRALGRARRGSKKTYKIPVGVLGNNTSVETAAIDGDVVALLARKQLSNWGVVLHLEAE